MNEDAHGNLILHCLWPNCTREEYPWCGPHDLFEFRRRARDTFGWSLPMKPAERKDGRL